MRAGEEIHSPINVQQNLNATTRKFTRKRATELECNDKTQRKRLTNPTGGNGEVQIRAKCATELETNTESARIAG